MSCCKIPKLLMNFSLCVTGVFVAVFVIVISCYALEGGVSKLCGLQTVPALEGRWGEQSAGGVVAVESDWRSLSVVLSA